MNYKELLNKKNIEGAYLLKGDAFLCQQVKNQIAQTLAISQINISEFNDENFDANNVINACNQFSFFEENRMVCVQNIQKELTMHEKEQIQNYLNNQNCNCVLIFIDEENFKFFDSLKNLQIVDCNPNQDYIFEHIKSEFAKNGKQITLNECKKLNEYCLSDITRINLEIKKICDYLNDKSVVTNEVIDLLVFKETELQVFALTDALGTKNKTVALRLLKSMLDSGESPIKILALITGQFRRMMFAKINKGSNADLAKVLGCKEFAITKAKEQAGRFSAPALKHIVNLLLDADYNIKSGQMSQENSIYYLILSILNQK